MFQLILMHSLSLARRSSEPTTKNSETPPLVNSSNEGEDIADEIQARLASIKGIYCVTLFDLILGAQVTV